MLKVIKAAAVAMMMPLLANAAVFEEGVHYEVISERGTKKPEVTEYFSFYCPACNAFEPLIAKVKPKLDDGVKFKKSHVDFVGTRDEKVQKIMSNALATAEVLPQKDQIVSAIFTHLHGTRGKINELADMKDIFVAQGVDGDKFDKLYKSFSVRTKASKMVRMQKQMQDKRALTGVPTFVVNGKYKLRLRESKTTTPEQISELINYLAAK
ncbi:disulfide bond formation protein [Pseudoalteromonas citrea]|uniref:Thiol:disulfide interchange protein n=2 Tax=Pseudoalteromonas TaxID=53246 RepID=A0A5S3V592_9GAMM|nr:MULTISPECIES: thiol:disulfide interchange protein DsbA/DsbL [Pseudoalteromonas]RJE78389.1 disulfide bond formation protein [Pseudoalteromonas sp. MSK9-3]TMO61414.1 disulfide bond formation protein [Pseudoalteromonas aurantia]TMO66337.1 disulfide bond formation protein [Pseudoalteromonas aurantia]TMO76532.1 disulfide bond formation protein [Pseudoalteromonas aurantia]TMP47351.1 disulfide bond formation protein [Pseudoalteromonas citrea]